MKLIKSTTFSKELTMKKYQKLKKRNRKRKLRKQKILSQKLLWKRRFNYINEIKKSEKDIHLLYKTWPPNHIISS